MHFRYLSQLANFITVCRIIGVGFIFWLSPVHSNLSLLCLLLIYAVVCLTDFFDGYIARRLNIVTDIGKILDPLADKILILVFLPLLQMHLIAAFPVFLILTREFIIMGVRVVAAKQGIIISAGVSGKIKTALTLPICGILFAKANVLIRPLPFILQPLEAVRLWILHWPQWVTQVLVAIMVIVTLWSLLDYLRLFMWRLGLEKARLAQSRKGLRRFRVLIPNAITALNLGCGILSCVLVWIVDIRIPVFLVLLGTVLDSLDGKLARRLNVSSEFGATLDSKADSINFGLAPALIIVALLMSTSFVLAITLGFLYGASVYYRLRRFDKGGHGDYFEGLPSPVGAGLVVLGAVSEFITPIVFSGIVIILSGLMISTFLYPHMDISRRIRLFRFLRLPVLTCFGLVVARLWEIPFMASVPSVEILMVLMLPYLLSPLFFMKFLTSRTR